MLDELLDKLELNELLDELELSELLELDWLLDVTELLNELELSELLELGWLLAAIELLEELGMTIIIWLLDELLCALLRLLCVLLEALLLTVVELDDELGIGLLPVSSLLVLEFEEFCDEVEVALTLLALEKADELLLSPLPPPQALSVRARVRFNAITDERFIIAMLIPEVITTE